MSSIWLTYYFLLYTTATKSWLWNNDNGGTTIAVQSMFITNQATFTQRRACNLTLTLDSWLITLSTIPSVTRYTITWTILWAASSFSLSILQRLLTCWRTSPKSDRYLINPAERPSVSLPSRQGWIHCLVESTTIEPVPWAVHLFFLFLPKVVALQHQCVGYLLASKTEPSFS